KLLHVVTGPDLRAQEPETHLDESVVQVNEDDVVTALGDLVVEGDRADLLRVGVFKTLEASGPGTRERRHSEDRAIWCTGQRNGLPVGLVRKTQRRAYRPLDVVGHEALFVPGLVQPLMEFGHTFAKVALRLHEAARFLHPGFGLS